MGWDTFYIYAIVAVLFWVGGAFFAFRGCRKSAVATTAVGSLVFFIFIVGLWAALQRPPLRTMGETRLWYSFFLSLIGLFLYVKYKYGWMLGFGALMSLVFTFINLLKPEIHSTTLMPALQSPWFVPHVIVYMFSYAMMGAVTLFAGYLWLVRSNVDVSEKEFVVCDNLVRIGWAFLTLGMTMGALWAKEAWGDYWTWDPKETWAFATWLSYLLYLHLRPANKNHNLLFALLMFSFILLQMCWWGI
ncbi:MAG: cytochrome c biogenesis protein CcsA, partial [Bacteroidaceae bacterium]|nr:cytochrome c biogenesis protein CcsA [Bacteroidaceae bacterium]